ncbi:MAG: SUMF1/EgtB/PvdO family nonheme iron enzyme [Pseudomonadota bacterium]
MAVAVYPRLDYPRLRRNLAVVLLTQYRDIQTHEIVAINGGVFAMGSAAHYIPEGPVREVRIEPLSIDQRGVTNGEFAKFVAETRYVTVAGRPLNPADCPGAPPELLVPGSLVFHMTQGPVDTRNMANWWSYVPHACWGHPEGPDCDLNGREDHPVEHIAFEDALAFAEWTGKDLPTEAEWECAARGGLEWAEFASGEENPRKEFFYWTDGGDLTNVRYDCWKLGFLEQRSLGLDVWQDPLVQLRFPKLFDLRIDSLDRPDHEAGDYPRWRIDHAFVIVPAQAIVDARLQTLVEFPPRQAPGSFALDQVLDQLLKAAPH